MEIHSNDSAASAFRAHRHDVLNALQLVRAYIQMNRPEAALRSVDSLASWLQSLGSLQNQIGDQERIFWLFVGCPHIEVGGLSRVPMLSDAAFHELRSLWLWLEEQCANNGFRRFEVDVHGSDDEAGTHLQIRLKRTEEMVPWWNNIHSVDLNSYGFGQLVTLTLVE